MGLVPHQEPVAVQVPVVWVPVAQVQTHEPAELPVSLVVGTAWALLLVLAAVGVTDSRSVAGYKQSPQQ